MKKLLLIAFLLSGSMAQAQLSQTIRGRIVDKETKATIVGATVVLPGDSGKMTGAISDVDGNFRIPNVPIGRRSLQVKLIGYQEVYLSNIIVDAGKEVILTIEMEESVATMNEVTVTATKKEEVSNEMSSVSARGFSIEETNRYAGSRSDPARMASNFAGCQGADDSRNDIVIRGNSPMGLLWRVEGVDIPNPNHFAVPGTTGGAISILNNKIFGNSDFFTGAFPAEYGNANAGVFDIRLRNGNNEKHEFTGQFGFLGTELAAEGPLNKEKGCTYLATYRYSTLAIFNAIGIPLGTSAVPNYQDASFKLNFPAKKAGNFSLFGIGGNDNIDIILSDKSADEVEVYGDNNRDQHFSTGMGMLGLTHSKQVGEKSYLKTTLAGYASKATAVHEIFTRDSVNFELDTIYPKMGYTYNTFKYSLNSSITKKFSAKHTFKAGVLADMIIYDFVDSNFVGGSGKWDVRNNAQGSTYLVQPYLQWKYKRTDNLVFNLGVHAQYFSLNGSYSVEPRAGMRWNFRPKQSLSLGYGMHSQMQPLYIYLHRMELGTGEEILHNKNLDFSRSQHFVLGYDNALSSAMRMKAEVYYQMLNGIPVDNFPSSFSLVNQGSSFSRFFPYSLENTGTGTNYGLEFTLEKFFSKTYFFMITASLYDSKYKGRDGVERNTDFNGNFAVNGLIGKEFELKKTDTRKTVLSTGSKVTWAGGKRYSPADVAASEYLGELVELDSLRNSLQFNDYFRLDFKLGLKINTKKLTHEIAIDLVNVLNTKNVLGLSYAQDPKNPTSDPIRKEYQLGFLPLFYYKIDF